MMNKHIMEIHKDVIDAFEENTNRLFNKIDGCNANEIEAMVRAEIEEYGLDIVVSYTGRVREDTAFNIFHEDIYSTSQTLAITGFAYFIKID